MKTGINFERCNVGSAEMHNTRDPEYIAAVNASPNKKYSIFEDQTKKNTSWVNPEYSGKSLPGLLDELRAIYKDKVGQAPQEEDRVREITDKKTGMKRTVTTAGWSPIREGVCPILPTTTISDFGPFIEWLQSKGLQAVRLDLHHDEGHTDELTGERNYNHHAHLVVDWIDHTTGKTRKLSKIDTSEMQTQLAASLRMERGVSKEITGADHLSPDEQRAKAAAEKVKQLEAKAASLDTQIAETAKAVVGVQDAADKAIRQCCQQLQHIGQHTVKNFDLLLKPGAVKPTKTEQQSRDRLDEESRRDLTQTKGSDLLHEEATLRNLIYQTALAVERIGRKLQELAKAVPFWKKHRLAHEADLQARVATAEEKAANSTAEAENARNRAENARNRAEDAEARANARDKQAKETLQNLQTRIDEAHKAGRKEAIAEWDKAYAENYKPTADERDRLKTQVAQLKKDLDQAVEDHRSQAVNTAKDLQRQWGAAPFEKAGLEFTEFGSWQTAKKELQQERQQQRTVTKSGGVKMG